MISPVASDDHAGLVAALGDPARGYALVRGILSEAEIDAYREECARFVRNGPVRYTRINADDVADYIHPRSHDKVDRTHRIYQYLHNRHSEAANTVFDRALALRNKCEEAWLGDADYRAERARLQDYVIVTKYVAGTGTLPLHRDYAGPAKLPLIQSLILLSQQPDDYTGGEFWLHPRVGERIGLTRDAGARKGDLFMFDKALDHSVDLTHPGTKTDIGRWTVLVGARALRDSPTRAFMKRFLYTPPFYPYSRPLAKVLRILGVPT